MTQFSFAISLIQLEVLKNISENRYLKEIIRKKKIVEIYPFSIGESIKIISEIIAIVGIKEGEGT